MQRLRIFLYNKQRSPCLANRPDVDQKADKDVFLPPLSALSILYDTNTELTENPDISQLFA